MYRAAMMMGAGRWWNARSAQTNADCTRRPRMNGRRWTSTRRPIV
jgi:hypothetical protein